VVGAFVLAEVVRVGKDCPGVACELIGEGAIALSQEADHHE
jgi:glycosyltransferase A (GT-A) superfamily protein (DUF2064 family)